jgi:hypothetical protein
LFGSGVFWLPTVVIVLVLTNGYGSFLATTVFLGYSLPGRGSLCCAVEGRDKREVVVLALDDTETVEDTFEVTLDPNEGLASDAFVVPVPGLT